jgi:hypothetical protein
MAGNVERNNAVIASEAKQSSFCFHRSGLLPPSRNSASAGWGQARHSSRRERRRVVASLLAMTKEDSISR